MGQPAPACCVCLATSVLAQGVYLGLLVLCFVAGVVHMAVDNEDPEEKMIRVRHFTGFVILATAVTMSSSRVCAPCCCEGLEEAGPCCPCSCFLHLDTPLYVMTGLGIIFGFLGSVVPLRGLRVVGPALHLASVICAVVKLCIMAQLCCQDCLPKVETATTPPAHDVPVVIGQPVGVPAPVGTGKVEV